MSKSKRQNVDGDNGTVAEKEAKDVKFIRLANKRVPRAIKALRTVANLATRAAYDYTDEQRDLIVRTLRLEMQQLEERFSGAKQRQAEWSL